MVEKKLLTLACAVGILACGGCFLLPDPKPPALPVRIDVSGIRTIGVEVLNSSETHHLDPNTLARRIRDMITLQARDVKVKAVLRKGTAIGNEDATLQVTILGEHGEPEQPESRSMDAKWDFQVRVSAILTKKNGTVVWRESNPDYRFSTEVPPVKPAEILAHPSMQYFLTDGISERLVARMLSGQ
jgi:hypothetical protein